MQKPAPGQIVHIFKNKSIGVITNSLFPEFDEGKPIPGMIIWDYGGVQLIQCFGIGSMHQLVLPQGNNDPNTAYWDWPSRD